MKENLVKLWKNSILQLSLLSCVVSCSDPAFIEKTETRDPQLKPLSKKKDIRPAKELDQAGMGNELNAGSKKLGQNDPNSQDAEKSLNPLILKVSDRVKFEKKIDASNLTSQLTFAMTGLPYTGKALMQQTTQTTGTHETIQGSPANTVTERFAQAEMGVLDILLVIDNSGSMAEEQTNLSTKLSPLLTSISQSNWKIGVITTDAAQPYLRGLISKNDMNASRSFKDAVEAGTGGDGNEQSILQSVVGLNKNLEGTTGSWLRQDSSVAVVIVSDEDNCSAALKKMVNGVEVLVGKDCQKSASSKSKYLFDNIPSGRQIGKDFKVYGLFAIPGTECKTAENVGNILQELVAGSGGTSGSICDSDYTTTLRSISSGIAAQLKSQFVLKQDPMGGSVISISINGTALTTGYSVKEKTIEFENNFVPAAGSTIEIKYQPLSNSVFTELKVISAPSGVNTQVAVNNVPLNPSDFSYDLNLKLVKFASTKIPPAGSNVKVTWINGELNRKFLLEEAVEVDSLNVTTESGEKLKAQYVPSTKSVDFETPPAAGTKFEVNWQGKKGKKLSYFLGNQAALVKEALNSAGKKLDFKIDQENILLQEPDVVPGQNVVFTLEKVALANEINLDPRVISGSIVVKIDGKNCDGFSRNANNNIVIDTTACALNSKSTLVLQYEMPASSDK
jgi:hypothetical protein